MAQAYVTLVTNDTYGLGALVLARSLKQYSTSKKLCCMITADVSDSMKSSLQNVYDDIVVVNVFDSQDSANLALLKRPELGITFTKLHCWSLTQYEKCVFLDADCLIIQNCDELFDNDEFAAVTDIGWPDCFNSGVFVFKPSQETYNSLLDFAVENGSFDGGDQGVLNQFFPSWNRLSFVYNMVASIVYSYSPAYKQFGANVKIVHFLGSLKPWDFLVEGDGRVVTPQGQFYGGIDHVQKWWDLFRTSVRPSLADTATGVARRLATMSFESSQRLQQWEMGTPSYQSEDSFSNIERKIAESIEQGQQQEEKAPEPPKMDPPQ